MQTRHHCQNRWHHAGYHDVTDDNTFTQVPARKLTYDTGNCSHTHTHNRVKNLLSSRFRRTASYETPTLFTACQSLPKLVVVLLVDLGIQRFVHLVDISLFGRLRSVFVSFPYPKVFLFLSILVYPVTPVRNLISSVCILSSRLSLMSEFRLHIQ